MTKGKGGVGLSLLLVVLVEECEVSSVEGEFEEVWEYGVSVDSIVFEVGGYPWV